MVHHTYMNIPANTNDGVLVPTNEDYHPANVLFIIDSLPLGGAERQVVTLASSLNGNRYKFYVCCLRNEGVQANELRSNGIPVVSLKMRLRFWPMGMYRLYRLIRHLKPKIIHTHLYESGIWGRLVGIFTHTPVILTTEHSLPFPKRRYLLLERITNHFTDKMIAVSEEIRQKCIHKQGVPPDKVITIPTAVDIAHFQGVKTRNHLRNELGMRDSSPLIGTIARLVRPKRLDYLLEAARLVCNKVPKARFVIIGDGPLREELNNQAEELGLIPGCVSFLGSRFDIPEILSSLDIFILSSELEGLPVALLEAMASTRPVIATRVGGIPQVIQDGYNGILVSPHDPTGLANAIFAVIEDNTLSRSMAIEGFRTIESRYSINAVGQQIVSLYDSMLKKKCGYPGK
jgi:glycosyltransferase involved in cell wall biosynthesis